MSASAPSDYIPDNEFIVIYDVPWEAYERILDALGEFHLRHAYDRGTLEMRRVLFAVPPEAYRQFLEALPEHRIRHTYDGWTLEMMSPRKDHEWIAWLLGRMIESMTYALGIPIQTAGATTLAARDVVHGVQPDASYYIANEARVRGKDTYEPGVDPPPDLVVEIDITRSFVPRLPTYALIGVPEIWRYDRQGIRFYRLSEAGEYVEADRSTAFPFIGPADLMRFLGQRHGTDEHTVVRAFVEWAEKARPRESK